MVGYLIYALTKNVYQNYKVDKIIESYRLENQKIEDLIQNKTEEYLYVTSEEYIDKIAKQNLGFVNPGEEIIVLSSDVLSEGLSDDKFFSGKDVKESVPMQWKNVFFDD